MCNHAPGHPPKSSAGLLEWDSFYHAWRRRPYLYPERVLHPEIIPIEAIPKVFTLDDVMPVIGW